MYEAKHWHNFRCRMPLEAMRRLEDALEKAKLLANINSELPDDVQDGLAMEYLAIEFLNVPDESVI